MAGRRWFNNVSLAMIMVGLACPLLWAAGTTDKQPAERIVSYQRIHMSDYDQFVKNWDDKKYPVLYALIQTPAQYDDLFHPAPVMGRDPAYTTVGSNEQIIVVARVIACPPQDNQLDKIFEVEKIVARDKELVFYYRFKPMMSTMTFYAKDYLAVRIPKYDYKKVTFFENGKQVGELKPPKTMFSSGDDLRR